MGEVWRSRETQALYVANGRGSRLSNHPRRLAADLQLFVDGVWQRRSEEYRELGAMWKALHPGCVWGGDWKSRVDGNHFELSRGALQRSEASRLPDALVSVLQRVTMG